MKSFSVKSDGHPFIKSGHGLTREAALLDFVQNADAYSSQMRHIFSVIVGDSIEKALVGPDAEAAFQKIVESRAYGPIVVSSS